jgi:hypothetical protein
MFPMAIKFRTPQDGMQNRVLDIYSDCENSVGTIANQLTSRLEKIDFSVQKASEFSVDNYFSFFFNAP